MSVALWLLAFNDVHEPTPEVSVNAIGHPRLFGDVIWVLFIGAQAADGVFTYLGLRVFGVGMEGNPLISWYAATFGIGAALASAKLLAATCAAFLHLVGRHVTLAVLTIVYLVGAVWPWSELLWP